MLNERSQQFIIKIAVGVFAAAACFLLVSKLPTTVNNVNADSGVEINDTNFPDDNFRSYVLSEIDVKNKSISD